MMIRILAAACCTFLSAGAMATATDSCPAPSAITNTQGIYTAPTANNEGEWLGVISSGPASAVKSFEMAVFYPAGNISGTMGTLGYCGYKTDDDVGFNLRYRPNESPDVRVNLAQLENWKEDRTVFGQVLYECVSTAPQGCAFVKAP